jgi:O-antigen/teichoic acid export membrane protein
MLRVAAGLLLLKLSTSFLSVGNFTVFAQLILFAALLNLVAVGGTQNGIIRQAAASGDAGGLAQTQTAALMIWAAAAPVLFLPLAVASPVVSDILVGSRDHWAVVIAIAALALAAGPGQIWCSILSGRKRVPSSLAAQAAGLLTSTGAATILIVHGEPIAAAVAFASGPLVTMTAAFLFAGPLRIGLAAPREAVADVRTLIRYSAAFAATSGYTAIVLFGLRSLYREEFGATALGYWMAANRVSDMSTQFLGLFMIQFFVAHVATMDDASERQRFVVRCWAAGVVMMSLALATFSAAAEPLVRLLLSEAFVPAIPAIRTYMVGDVLRVWASLAMFSAFARGKPRRYAMIEIATLTVMAIVVTALIWAGEPRAPQLGYVAAYATTAVAVTLAFAALRSGIIRRLPSLRWPRRGAHQRPRRGSAEPLSELPIAPTGPSPAAQPPA